MLMWFVEDLLVAFSLEALRILTAVYIKFLELEVSGHEVVVVYAEEMNGLLNMCRLTCQPVGSFILEKLTGEMT